jgi:hypothetical protein
VYGLLDDAWERYSAFCDAYEATGKSIYGMVRELEAQLGEHLPSNAALLGATFEIWQLEQKEHQVSEKFRVLEEELDAQMADKEQLKKMFPEMAGVLVALAEEMGYRGFAQQVLVSAMDRAHNSFHRRYGAGLSDQLKEKLLKVVKENAGS